MVDFEKALRNILESSQEVPKFAVNTANDVTASLDEQDIDSTTYDPKDFEKIEKSLGRQLHKKALLVTKGISLNDLIKAGGGDD